MQDRLLEDDGNSGAPQIDVAPKKAGLLYASRNETHYYLKYWAGFLVSFILPGVEHFFISQWQKAISLTITACFLRYGCLTGLGVAAYFAQTELEPHLGARVTVTLLIALIGIVILSNEYLIYFDYVQLLQRQWYGYPIAPGEFSVRCVALGAACIPHSFWTWLPDNAPSGWLEGCRDVESRIRIGRSDSGL